MSIHKDHRQRVKKRFMKEGLENFDDLHILELMLFYCVPRRDTNIMAHNLLNKFGSLSGVLDATPEQLRKVEDIGDGVVTFIRFQRELYRAYEIRRSENIKTINSHHDIQKCLQAVLSHRRNEIVYVICMDAKRNILCIEKVSEGDVSSAGVPIRRIVEVALGCNASSVVLAHNHPGGIAAPSPEDVSATLDVAAALRAVEIELADHAIFTDNEFTSMKQAGVYNPGMKQEVII